MRDIIVGWIYSWRESILVSLNVVDTSGYLTIGLMILLCVIVIICRLIFVDTIILEMICFLDSYLIWSNLPVVWLISATTTCDEFIRIEIRSVNCWFSSRWYDGDLKSRYVVIFWCSIGLERPLKGKGRI